MPTHAWHIQQATRALHAQGVIAYPTEAVWGLGCDPFSQQAFECLLDLKQRPSQKGVILIGSRFEHFDALLSALPPVQRARVVEDSTTPTTWLVPDSQGFIPAWIRGKHPKVAIRISQHPLVQALCDTFGGPVVSTSANPAGKAPARSALRVRQYFPCGLTYLLPGELGGYARPSRIIDLATGTLLRA